MNGTNGHQPPPFPMGVDDPIFFHQRNLALEVIAQRMSRQLEQRSQGLQGGLAVNVPLTLSRDALINRGTIDPRRDIARECGHPDTWALDARELWELVLRNPLAGRANEIWPKESWKVQPDIYETEDDDETAFEKAWDALGNDLTEDAKWFKEQSGNGILQAFLKVDILAGVGQFGILVLGLDDGRPLSEPVQGVEETNSSTLTFEPEKDAEGNPVRDEETGKIKGNWRFDRQGLTVNAKGQERWKRYGIVWNANDEPEEKVRMEGETDSAGDVGAVAQGDDGQNGEAGPRGGGSPEETGGEKERPKWKPRFKLLYLSAFAESQVQITRFEMNKTSRRYGQPVEYLVDFADPNTRNGGFGLPSGAESVHWTRVIHVTDHWHMPNSGTPVFAVPRLLPVLNDCLDAYKVSASDAEGFYGEAYPGHQYVTHPEMGGDVIVDADAMRDAYENWKNSASQRALLSIGGKWEALSGSSNDPNPHWEVHAKAIAIKQDIAWRIWMGSERGELASSQDERQHRIKAQDRRNSHCSPSILQPAIGRFILLGLLPEPEQVIIRWPEEEALGEVEKANVLNTRTTAMQTFVNGGVNQLMDERTYLIEEMGYDEDKADQVMKDAKLELLKEEIEGKLAPKAQRQPGIGAEGPGGLPVKGQPPPPQGSFGAKAKSAGPGTPFGAKQSKPFPPQPSVNDATTNAGDNCGTGAGGFQGGNKCGAEDGQPNEKDKLDQAERKAQEASDRKAAADKEAARRERLRSGQLESVGEVAEETARELGEAAVSAVATPVKAMAQAAVDFGKAYAKEVQIRIIDEHVMKAYRALGPDQYEDLKGIANGIFSRLTLGLGPVGVKAVQLGIRHGPKAFRMFARAAQGLGRAAGWATKRLGEGARQVGSDVQQGMTQGFSSSGTLLASPSASPIGNALDLLWPTANFDENQPRDEDGKWTSFYHGTSKAKADKIRAEGKLRSAVKYEEGGAIYLTKNPEYAKTYGPEVFEVRLPMSKVERVNFEEGDSDNDDEDREQIEWAAEYTYRGNELSIISPVAKGKAPARIEDEHQRRAEDILQERGTEKANRMADIFRKKAAAKALRTNADNEQVEADEGVSFDELQQGQDEEALEEAGAGDRLGAEDPDVEAGQEPEETEDDSETNSGVVEVESHLNQLIAAAKRLIDDPAEAKEFAKWLEDIAGIMAQEEGDLTLSPEKEGDDEAAAADSQAGGQADDGGAGFPVEEGPQEESEETNREVIRPDGSTEVETVKRSRKAGKLRKPTTNEGDDCGTGAGGFKSGNTCGAKNGADSKSSGSGAGVVGAIKGKLTSAGKAIYEKLPKPVRKVIDFSIAAEHKLEGLYKSGQALAKEMARGQGLSDFEVERASKFLALADGISRWAGTWKFAHDALHPLGGPVAFLGAKTSYYVPVASLAYVGYHFAKDAVTGKDAIGRLKAARDRVRAAAAGKVKPTTNARDGKKSALDAAKWVSKSLDRELLMVTALDEARGNISQALALAKAASRSKR